MFFLEVVLVFQMLLALSEFFDFLRSEINYFFQASVFSNEGGFVSLEFESQFSNFPVEEGLPSAVLLLLEILELLVFGFLQLSISVLPLRQLVFHFE
jgi:hypothetical protein